MRYLTSEPERDELKFKSIYRVLKSLVFTSGCVHVSPISSSIFVPATLNPIHSSKVLAIKLLFKDSF